MAPGHHSELDRVIEDKQITEMPESVVTIARSYHCGTVLSPRIKPVRCLHGYIHPVVKHSTADPGIASSIPPHSN